MGVLTNRAIAASLLATVAFTSVAFDINPAEAGQRASQKQNEKDRAFQAGKQACINLARTQGVQPFPEAHLAFSSNDQIGCTFTLAADGTTPFKKYYDKGSQRDYDAYNQLFNNAVTRETAAADRQERADQRAAEQAERNNPVNRLGEQAGRMVRSKLMNKATQGLGGLLNNLLN